MMSPDYEALSFAIHTIDLALGAIRTRSILPHAELLARLAMLEKDLEKALKQLDDYILSSKLNRDQS